MSTTRILDLEKLRQATYFAQLQTSWNFTEIFLSNIWWILEQITTRGATLWTQYTPGRVRPPQPDLVGFGQPGPPPVPIFWYISHFDLEKQYEEDFWDGAPPSRDGIWSGALFPSRRGEIEAIVITNNPLIFGRPISINIFNITISSQTLVHLLCSIYVPKPQIDTCGLLVVLITSCSWC